MPQRYACPCCAHLTLYDKPPGTFAVCPVCAWVDDSVQFAAPDVADGANFRAFKASSRAARASVRAPRPEEAPREPRTKRA